MKKAISILLVLTMALSLFCGAGLSAFADDSESSDDSGDTIIIETDSTPPQ